jgi:hypothetical protein
LLPNKFVTETTYDWALVKEVGVWKLDSLEKERVEYSQMPTDEDNGGKKVSNFSGEKEGNLASISASAPALPLQDACDDWFTYEPANVVDGKPETAWQVSGTGVKQWIELKYDEPVKVKRVGIIPGYAKKDKCEGIDRFYQRYVVRKARIEFSDGSDVEANFEHKPEMKFVNVPDTETTSLRVIILDSYPPGNRPGGSSFDYENDVTIGQAAISEIKVEGS